MKKLLLLLISAPSLFAHSSDSSHTHVESSAITITCLGLAALSVVVLYKQKSSK